MEYKVVPFTAQILRSDSAATVATQLQSIIDNYVADGWEYARMDTVETSIAADEGCFGFGAKPAYITHFKVLVFKK